MTYPGDGGPAGDRWVPYDDPPAGPSPERAAGSGRHSRRGDEPDRAGAPGDFTGSGPFARTAAGRGPSAGRGSRRRRKVRAVREPDLGLSWGRPAPGPRRTGPTADGTASAATKLRRQAGTVRTRTEGPASGVPASGVPAS